jgi:hypothetical protein
MNKKFAQLAYFVSKIDRQHIQFAYFALILVAGLILPCPADGGTGPYGR